MKTYLAKDIFRNPDFPLDVSYSQQRSFMVPHVHDFIEIVLIAQGHTIHTIHSENEVELSYSLIQGDLFSILPGEVHSYSNSRNLVIYNAALLPKLLAKEMNELMQMDVGKVLFEKHPHPFRNKIHLPLYKRISAEKYLKRMMVDISMHSEGYRLSAKTNFLEFLILSNEIEPIILQDGETIADPFFETLKSMESAPAKSFHLKKQAASANMSVSAFTRKFREVTGDSPLDYCIGLRLAKVRELLTCTDMSISEIAYKNGFCADAYLIKLFRKRYGITPARYRKLMK